MARYIELPRFGNRASALQYLHFRSSSLVGAVLLCLLNYSLALIVTSQSGRAATQSVLADPSANAFSQDNRD